MSRSQRQRLVGEQEIEQRIGAEKNSNSGPRKPSPVLSVRNPGTAIAPWSAASTAEGSAQPRRSGRCKMRSSRYGVGQNMSWEES